MKPFKKWEVQPKVHFCFLTEGLGKSSYKYENEIMIIDLTWTVIKNTYWLLIKVQK